MEIKYAYLDFGQKNEQLGGSLLGYGWVLLYCSEIEPYYCSIVLETTLMKEQVTYMFVVFLLEIVMIITGFFIFQWLNYFYVE